MRAPRIVDDELLLPTFARLPDPALALAADVPTRSERKSFGAVGESLAGGWRIATERAPPTRIEAGDGRDAARCSA